MEKSDSTQAVVEDVAQEEQVQTADGGGTKHTLLWLVIIILFALFAGAAWFAYQQQLTQQEEISALASQVAASEQTKQTVMQLEQALTKEKITREQQLSLLTEADASLLEKMAGLAEAQQLTSNDVKRKWTLSEIEFLVQVANQRVLLAGDVTTAKRALSLADEQLNELADPRFYQLRTIIADEQLALASVVNVDIDGLAAKLQSGIDSIDSLRVLTGPEFTTGQMDEDATAQVSETWQAALSDAWQHVRSLVVIRHQQDGSSAILVPEQRYFLYQNLRLKLESAHFALLSNKEGLFHASLSAAEQWLQDYFIGSERDALLEVIREMQAEKITVSIPDISGSLRWLKQQGEY